MSNEIAHINKDELLLEVNDLKKYYPHSERFTAPQHRNGSRPLMGSTCLSKRVKR